MAIFQGRSYATGLVYRRTAVWKAINQLKEAGYEIEAQQNKATAQGSTDLMTEAEIKAPAHRLGGKGGTVF